MPGGRGSRVAVQQQHRRAISVLANEQRQSTGIDHRLPEPVEHAQEPTTGRDLCPMRCPCGPDEGLVVRFGIHFRTDRNSR